MVFFGIGICFLVSLGLVVLGQGVDIFLFLKLQVMFIMYLLCCLDWLLFCRFCWGQLYGLIVLLYLGEYVWYVIGFFQWYIVVVQDVVSGDQVKVELWCGLVCGVFVFVYVEGKVVSQFDCYFM